MSIDTDRPGGPSVPVPHFEARLWQELERLHGHRLLQAPDAGAGPGRPHRTRSARSRSVRFGIGLVAAAAVAADVLVVRDPDGPAAPSGGGSAATGPSTTGATGATEPPVSIETRIVNATEEAIAASVVKTTQTDETGQSGVDVSWTDEQSGRFRSLQRNLAGENSFDSGWRASGKPGRGSRSR